MDHIDLVDRFIASGNFGTTAVAKTTESRGPLSSSKVVHRDTNKGYLLAVDDETLQDLSERNQGVAHTIKLLGKPYSPDCCLIN